MKSILISVVFFTLMAMGTWQAQRLKWKNNLINNIKQEQNLPAVDLSSTTKNYKKIYTYGKFLHKCKYYLYYPLQDKNGYYVLVAFKTHNNKVVLINTGWTEKRSTEQISGSNFKIIGTIRYAFKAPRIRAIRNDGKNNIWFWIDRKKMQKCTKLPIEPYIIFQSNKNININIDIPNDHLGYAIMWYSLAFILLTMWISSILKSRNQK